MDDAQEMFDNYASDSEVTKYLTWNYHKNIETTKNYVMLKHINQHYEGRHNAKDFNHR